MDETEVYTSWEPSLVITGTFDFETGEWSNLCAEGGTVEVVSENDG